MHIRLILLATLMALQTLTGQPTLSPVHALNQAHQVAAMGASPLAVPVATPIASTVEDKPMPQGLPAVPKQAASVEQSVQPNVLDVVAVPVDGSVTNSHF